MAMNRWWRLFSAVIVGCVAIGSLEAAVAIADSVSFTTGCTTWTVPVGVSSIAITATGSAGSPGTSGGQGGSGGQVSGSAAVSHGQTLYVCAATPGAPGGTAANPGGAGGAASGASLGSDFRSPLIVAGGGGGGGGAAGGGTGGSAGATAGGATGNGSSGISFGVAGPGAGGQGGSGTGPSGGGGGGGGAGYTGGGGGGGNALSGTGGGAGSDFCASSVTGCSPSSTSGPAQVTLTYTVASSPTTSITTPANGATYQLNHTVASSFSCAEGANGPATAPSCTDQNGRASGAPVDTSTTGSHSFTVTAVSSDGLTSSSTVTYKVAAAPVVWLPLPASGATFTVNQAVNSYFLCADGKGGPGLASCVDQNGRQAGAPIDTSTVGTHTFTITATSGDGQTASTTSTYTVVPLPTVSNVKARHGVVSFDINLSAPGTVDAMAAASFNSFALSADIRRRARAASPDTLQPARGTFVYGRAEVIAGQAGKVSVVVTQSQVGKLLLRDHRGTTVQLVIAYTGTNGVPQTVTTSVLRVNR